MAEGFRSRILSRAPLLGAFLTWPVEGHIELLALSGFDFAVLDTEHGFFNPESVERMVRAAEGAELPVIVRVPSCLASRARCPTTWPSGCPSGPRTLSPAS